MVFSTVAVSRLGDQEVVARLDTFVSTGARGPAGVVPVGSLEWSGNRPGYITMERDIGYGCLALRMGSTFQAPGRPLVMARGFFNQIQAYINVKELQAVKLAILSFFPRPAPQHAAPQRIRLQVDNQVVMYILRHLTTPSLELMKEVRALFYLLEARKLLLEPKYIASKDNTIPDWLSRFSNRDDYRLATPFF